MKQTRFLIQPLRHSLLGSAWVCAAMLTQATPDPVVVTAAGPGSPNILFWQSADKWGVDLRSADSAILRQPRPVGITIFDPAGQASTYAESYAKISKTEGGLLCSAEVSVREGLKFVVDDRWDAKAGTLHLKRRVRVSGDAAGGFVSTFMLETEQPACWSDFRLFVPGTMYGAPEHVPYTASGGLANVSAGVLELREDAMPAPLLGIYFGNGTSVSILDPNPVGETTAAEFESLGPKGDASQNGGLTSDKFLFGGMGGRELPSGKVEFGYWFPGSQALLTNTNIISARNRLRRYHPIRDRLIQQYELSFRIGREERFHDFMKASWRWSWDTLRPAVEYKDLAVVRRCLIDMLAEQVETHDNRSGLPNSINLANHPRTRDPKAIMGFTGKCLEAAVFLVMDAESDTRAIASEHRKKALAIINSFLRIKVAPPEAEGFDMETGALRLALPRDNVVYLRSFTDDMKMLLRGYKFEQRHGRDHPEWLKWCRDFGDWLLTQQQREGGFPRTWEPGTGKVISAAPQSSYNAVPFLLLLSEATADPKYSLAAARAAEFCWASDQVHDRFVGGTIDNPNIIDKEAATLSTEAYLALFGWSKDRKWLHRAQAAADFAETFAYLWNVPMPADAGDSRLHWKRGVSTIGLNVCSTGGPGAGDQYLAFDVDEFAAIYKHTGDKHYFDVARLLLHNTKNMLALPGRTFDLPGPGWQTEHFSSLVPGVALAAITFGFPGFLPAT